MATSTRDLQPALIVYDGACFFCENYTALVSLREEIGPVELLDARSGDPRVDALWRQGYDLNAGMVFMHDGQIHHGHEATRQLALLSNSSTLFGRFNRLALSHPLMARMTYPLLKLGRLASLKIRKKGLLKDPRDDS